MANAKQKKNAPPGGPRPTTQPALTSASKPSEPTAAQTTRIADATSKVEGLNQEHGAPVLERTTDPATPSLSLEEALKKVEGLLQSARAHFEKARKAEDTAEHELKRLTQQARDQEQALVQRAKAAEAKLAETKRAADAEVATKQRAVDQAELDLLVRLEGVDKREAALSTRESATRAAEAKLVERGAQLTERELNAEQGFLAEKARILRPIEDEVKRLREARDHLETEIAEARERAEEAHRAKAKVRAEKWAEQDAARTDTEADARRKLDESMAQERQEKLNALRAELSTEREDAEAAWQDELERRTAALNDREAELDDREAALTARQKALRSSELDLKAMQEILGADQAALERKVESFAQARTEDLRHEAATLRTQLDDARAQRDTYYKDMESRRELDRRFGGRAPDEILSALNTAEQARAELTRQLQDRPDARAAERLSALERERSAWQEERALFLADLAKAQGELASRRLAAIELEALRKEKEALEVHKQLLDEAVRELRTRVEALTKQDEHRNPMAGLTSMDEDEELKVEARTTTPFGKATLEEFAKDLRHRIARGVAGRELYYAERDVRSFLGGLAMTRLMLLQGISGTGKTSLPLAFAGAIGGGVKVVPVQAGWRDRQDLIGYFNAFQGKYYATPFLEALYEAGTPKWRDRPYLIVLDEMNLSRPEQFFADFLSQLEQPPHLQTIDLLDEAKGTSPRLLKQGKSLPIPPNVWFIGTANHDESTAEFADKTYDRAHVMEMPRKTDEAHFAIEPRGERNPVSFEKLEAAFNGAAVAQKKAVHTATTWLRQATFADTLQRTFRVGWGNRLENQLSRYLPVVVETGGSVGEAMDHLLVTKVLRKLKDRHDVRVPALEALTTELQAEWKRLDKDHTPERCVALLSQEIAAKKGEEQE